MMNVKINALLVLLFPVMLSGCSSSSVKEPDLSKFHGNWVVVELNDHGKQADAKTAQRRQVTITQDGKFQQVELMDKGQLTGITAGGKGGNFESTMQVNDTKTPAEIDLVFLQGEDTGKSKQGIFVFEGDRLKICLADLGQPRPTTFTADPSSTLMVLERKKD